MIFQKNKETLIKEAEDEISDCIEAKEVLDNAIKCGFLFDKHSLECQKWIKEYQMRKEYLEIHLDEIRSKNG
mgnify:CR=1 FL=1|jgi:glycerol-3-phosphate responsive antiterminator